MQKVLMFVFLICAGVLVSGQNKFDVLTYAYSIYLNEANDSIKGVGFIGFVANENLEEIAIDLAGINRENKGMVVENVQVDPSKESKDFRHENDKIIIRASIKKGDTSAVFIQYKGIPADGLIISKNKYGDKTFFADNWPNRAHQWIPCVDVPGDKASFSFDVYAPSAYGVVSNGVKLEEKELGDGKKLTRWKETTPLPTKVMVIGVAKFAVKTYKDSPENIPVSAWVYPQDSTAGFKNYAAAPAILKFMSGYIGPYPYKKLANVQSKTIYGGMENASAIFYYEESATSKSSLEGLLAHEIAHQWFGDMATEKSFPHVWLSEGFATYFTHLYMQSKYGVPRLNERMKKDRDQIIAYAKQSTKPIVDSVSELKQLLNTNSYEKGSWILHMLRRQYFGDSMFHKVIQSYYRSFAGKNADTRDFQEICERESNQDLSKFFDQWLYSPGIPNLDIKWSYDADKKILVFNITQLQDRPFDFPLDIEIQTKGKPVYKVLPITKRTEQFQIDLKDKPVKITPDPITSLLFEGSLSGSN